MPRLNRTYIKSNDEIYHIISRTALDGFVLDEFDKERFFNIIKWASEVYFAKVYGYCIMGNHFHLVAQIKGQEQISEEDLSKRIRLYYHNDDKKISKSKFSREHFRAKFEDLSEYVKEIKQRFSVYYNRRKNRKGYFWSDRFKSVMVERGETLVNLLAYIDLNPVRANIVKVPEEYRWCSLAYHVKQDNEDEFLDMDYGIEGIENYALCEKLRNYREFVYEKGSLKSEKGKSIGNDIIKKERDNNFVLNDFTRLSTKSKCFSEALVLGSKKFVQKLNDKFENLFERKKKIHQIGDSKVYSFKSF